MPHHDEAFHEALQVTLYEHALTLLANGLDVVLEDGLWTKPERAEKLADAHRVGARTHLHFFDLSLDTLRDRVEGRNAELPSGAVPIDVGELERWHETVFDRPDEEELSLFDEVTIYGDDS